MPALNSNRTVSVKQTGGEGAQNAWKTWKKSCENGKPLANVRLKIAHVYTVAKVSATRHLSNYRNRHTSVRRPNGGNKIQLKCFPLLSALCLPFTVIQKRFCAVGQRQMRPAPSRSRQLTYVTNFFGVVSTYSVFACVETMDIYDSVTYSLCTAPTTAAVRLCSAS